MKVFIIFIFFQASSSLANVSQSQSGFDYQISTKQKEISDLKKKKQNLYTCLKPYAYGKSEEGKKRYNKECPRGPQGSRALIKDYEKNIKNLELKIASLQEDKKQLDVYTEVQKKAQTAIEQASAKNKVDKSSDMTTLVSLANVGMGMFLLPNCFGLPPNGFGCGLSMLSFGQARQALKEKQKLNNVSDKLSGLKSPSYKPYTLTKTKDLNLSQTDCKAILKKYGQGSNFNEACEWVSDISTLSGFNPSSNKPSSDLNASWKEALNSLNKKLCSDGQKACPKLVLNKDKFSLINSKGVPLFNEDLEQFDPKLKKQAYQDVKKFQNKHKNFFEAINTLDEELSSFSSKDASFPDSVSSLNAKAANFSPNDSSSPSHQDEELLSLAPDKKKAFKNLWKQFNNQQKKPQKNKKSVMAGQDTVGIMQDNIFLMIHRRYQEREDSHQFIETINIKKRIPSSQQLLFFPETS